MKTLGRIIARGPKVGGLFIPMGDCELDGIYEIVEILDELTVRRIGTPNIPPERFRGLDLDGLFAERPNCAMTKEELQQVEQTNSEPDGHQP